MNTLYKTTLLITIATVTWKVWKIEVNTRRLVIDSRALSNYLNENSFVIPKDAKNSTDSAHRLLKFAKQINSK
ncbi:TPA: hypothetical protein P1U96_001530 [Staphylococcus aureus]|nr:hypothetical protein [Staphylococcus aureus]HDN3490973.1 hypothetical protein [Staphylococcus aureus]HDZ8753966.1 hypothetical protein [Staphylococcus aureus]HEK6545010.1 hypothetical protein [Staphylococcus aureus]